jgi:hypothetical protein
VSSRELPDDVTLLDWPYVGHMQENADGERPFIISRLVVKNP